MAFEFPELNTIGALFRFAGVLEQAAIAVLERAAEASEASAADGLRRMAAKHRQRAEELDRARREKLNETVLEPLMDMPRDPYVPDVPDELAGLDSAALTAIARDVEGRSELFYRDAADKAGAVLAEVKRLFARYQKEAAKNVASLG
jgi:hypothetical protein